MSRSDRRNGGGLGDDMERDYRLPQYRDYGQGDPRAKMVVWDPETPVSKLSKDQQAYIKEWMDQMGRLTRKSPFIVQKPAFQDPPFFAKPIVVIGQTDVPPGGAVLPRPFPVINVEDRQWGQFTCIGFDIDEPQLLADRDLRFWITVNDEIVPLFNEISPLPPPGGPLLRGQTTIFPGSIEQPFGLRACGVSFGVRGPSQVRLNFQNFDVGQSAIVRILLTYYQYWLPKSDEFQHSQYEY